MYAIIALVLIGSWFIGNMAGHDRYAQILGTEPGALEMIMGIIGATVGCHLFLYTSSTRRLNSPPTATAQAAPCSRKDPNFKGDMYVEQR